MEDPPVSPEILCVGEEMAFMGGYGDRNLSFGCFVVALALVAMMMGMQDPIYLRDAHCPKMIQNLAGAEIDQHATRSVANDVNIAGVVEPVQVVRNLARRAARSESR